MNEKRIALIIPHTDTTLETDLQKNLPDNYILHTHRIWLDEVGEEAEKKMVDEELPKGLTFLKGIIDFDAVIFGCTSASAVYGVEGLKRLEEFISSELNCRGRSAFGAVLEQIDRRHPGKISLITPYTPQVNEFMVKSLNEFGVEVSFFSGLGLTDDTEIAKVRPESILNLIESCREEIQLKSDLLFVSCTNFRSMEVRKEIEALLEMDVVTSNHSIFDWLISE
jgi:maleate isomerase